ncbi:MAG: anti-sigma factor C-terminal domain-containing protein [Eubacteriales bacterium]|nr:anti-sigma factor C-terminal domain-containing protein [Eubacteriales bacterium]
MTYRELLEKYKEGILSEEERLEVEEAIEKHEAISDYLYEEGEIPELKDVFGKQAEAGQGEPGQVDPGQKGSEQPGTDQMKSGRAVQKGIRQKKDSEFVSLVNQSIRRAFMKLGVSVLAVSILLILFVQFLLPNLVSCFYYDPGKETGGYNQMSRDMAVYSELFLPCKRRDNVTVEAKGYGKYDFSVLQNFSISGKFNTVSGEIVRGKLKYYNSDSLKLPPGNSFIWFQAIGDLSKPLDKGIVEEYSICAAGTREEAKQSLQELDDKQYYIGYVSLNEMMDYENFVEYIDTRDGVDHIWCAVKTTDIEENFEGDKAVFRASNIGFNYSLISQTLLEWDREKYPELFPWSEQTSENKAGMIRLKKNLKSEDYMKQHFISLLSYMNDQKNFLKMMGCQEPLYQAAEYVKENGIKVYGFAAIMTKDILLQLSEEKEVYTIYTQPMD